MLLLFQSFGKHKLLFFKAQKLPKGAPGAACKVARCTYAAGNNKSLSGDDKGFVEWHSKMETLSRVLDVVTSAQWKIPQGMSTPAFYDSQSLNHSNTKTQLGNRLHLFRASQQ